MSYQSHAVEGLGLPFLSVDEAIFVVPRDGMLKLNRSRFKFLLFLDGQIEHEIEGLGRRPLKSGDILVVPEPLQHVYFNPDRQRAAHVKTLRLFLDFHYLNQSAGKRIRKPESDLSDFILHHFPRVMQMPGGVDSEISQIVSTLRRETGERAIGYRHRVFSLCSALVIAIARKQQQHGNALSIGAEPHVAKSSTSSKIVAAAREYAFKHLDSKITLGEIAWHVGKSEEYLARVFKKETGTSVFDFIREMRVNRAKTFLLDPGISLTTIATRCGFHSLSYFSVTFRKLTRQSPSEYRKQGGTTLRLLNGTSGSFAEGQTGVTLRD